MEQVCSSACENEVCFELISRNLFASPWQVEYTHVK